MNATATASGPKGKSMLIKWLITFAIPLMILFIPTNEVFTPELRKYFVLTVFFILVMVFEELPTFITAILIPTAYLVFSIVPANVAFSNWTGTTMWMIIGTFVLATVMDTTGLLNRVAYFIIKKFGGTFKGTVFGLFITGTIINLITFGQSYIIVVVMCYGVCKALNLKPGKESALLCFAGIVAGVDSCFFFYAPAYIGFMEPAIQAVVPGYTMGMFTMVQYNLILAPFYLIVLWLACKIFKADKFTFEGGKEFFDNKLAEMGKMSLDEKKCFIGLALIIVSLVCSTFDGLPAAYGFMIIPYLLFIPKIGVSCTTSAIKNITFPSIFFIAGCMTIGSVGVAVGFGTFVQSTIGPLMGGSSYVAYITIFIFGALAHLLMTPYGTMSGFAAPVAALAVSLGLNPVTACYALLMSTHTVVFPYQIAATNVIYGFGFYPIKKFMVMNALKSLGMLAFFAAAVLPVWMLMGLL